MPRLVAYIVLFTLILTGCSAIEQETSTFPVMVHEEVWKDVVHEGALTCTIDAKIIAPQTGKNSTSIVEKSPFSLFDANNLFHYFVRMEPTNFDLMAGEPIYLSSPEYNDIQALFDTDNIYFAFYPDESVIQFEQWIRDDDEYNIEHNLPTNILNIEIEKEQAQKFIDDIFSDLEIFHMSLASTDKARIISENNGVAEVISEGWYFVYTLNTGGCIPIDILRFRPNGKMLFPISTNYAPWEPERIRFYIDEEGLKYFEWTNRIHILEACNPVHILPIESVKGLIKDYIIKGYEGLEIHADEQPTLANVTLTSTLNKHSSDPNLAVLIPTWMVRFTNNLYQAAKADDFVFFINAITGERIDPQVTPDTLKYLEEYMENYNEIKGIEQ